MKYFLTLVFISFFIEVFVDNATSLPTLSKFENETKSVDTQMKNQTELPSSYPDYSGNTIQYTDVDLDNALTDPELDNAFADLEPDDAFTDLEPDNALQYTDLDLVQYADIDPDEFENEVAELLPEDHEIELEESRIGDDRRGAYRRRYDDDDRYYRRRRYDRYERRGYRRGDRYRYRRRGYGRILN
ncbi:7203_t:CDS:2 [Ambispora gerdemannii]|uniref:7203_t:CDS:1 n=1 Tax=Ambispora gerdemannii TaxID=144530 RepID=A0A9N9BAQ6_9GLOM|nr:7203_t:CDS:2 [Ambispora gerdemannii]